MTEVEQPPQNGIDLSSAAEDDDNSKARPADIEQDMREMERRKRVEAIMGSKLFREELERIVDSARDGGILQQLSDIMGVPASRVGTVFKSSNCLLPINDIRGVESMGYAKGEKILRCKLAATFRLLDLYGWTQGLGAQITARLKVDQEYFLVNPYGLLYHEITASSLNKVDMQGQIVEQGTTNFGVNRSHFVLHSVVHAARPDIRCIIYIGCSPVVAVSSLKTGLLPLTKDACVLGEVTTHQYTGTPLDTKERDALVRNLGPNSKVLILSNYGALCCGETIEEAFFAACHIVQACETQLKLLPVGLDNLVLIPEESRKTIYEQSRRPPEDLEKKFAAVSTAEEEGGAKEGAAIKATGGSPKWRVGGAEFEALMRMLDNAGYRTGYIYRHPLIKSDPPKPKNDVELPPAVSSLGYLLEEEELLRQGIWKKGDFRKGGDRSRWLNSPNVYQKVEVLETGTPDPKKITKWVAEGSPTHSTPVRIEDPLQFVPPGTNPKEFKRLQQQIKDNRRADKISAGPQSHILEGVTWDEANRIKDATVSSAGDHVVLMGAASKGIIQRGYQHNAAVYKAPYAKNPFDNVTDDELNEYKRTVERKKKSIHGEYTDTDFSESEPLSSLQTSGAQQTKQTTTTTAAVSQSEPEDISEHQVMRIETQQAPVPSQPEVVLSDALIPQYTCSYAQASHKMPVRTYPGHTVKALMKSDHITNKYAFLFDNSFNHATNVLTYPPTYIHVFMIHKIEIFPHYTFPLTDSDNNKRNNNTKNINNDNKRNETENDASSQQLKTGAKDTNTVNKSLPMSPYRTVSHYGFNYPLTYVPTITLHPAHLLTAVQLQRQKVIAFIKSTAMSLNQANMHHRQLHPLLLHTEPNNNVACAEDSNGSFISVKEIQLEPKPRRHRQRCHLAVNTDGNRGTEVIDVNATNNTSTTTNVAHGHEQDALSEHFSSLLSVGASYPAASNSHSHSGDHEREHEHEPEDHDEPVHGHDESDVQQHFDDSADNSSVFTVPQHTGYMLRNFLPIERDSDHNSPQNEHELQHKPEAEQALHEASMKSAHDEQIASHTHQQHKQIQLSVTSNALKRRCSHSSQEASSVCAQQRQRNRRHVSASVSETDSAATSLKSLEVHINITVHNSECVKSLQTHEQEFRKKLERLIDEEIGLISRQLSSAAHDETVKAFESNTTLQQLSNDSIQSIETGKRSGQKNTPHRCDLAVGSKSAEAAAERITGAQIHFNADMSANCSPSVTSTASTGSLRYQHTLALLEQELETLLNGIICANALHNHAVMCDCKMKISQISEGIRASLNATANK